ncbi:uncharacterized protein PHALS_01266 [Plasmopara halstedii]|uniref:Uncharacterized protein n=1 Tax=Plasmopara halstedii TaxID=4781 RepID=A0A0P1AUK0_PLAHL|nr:uncharacterized protein PHALS_01266 [Plasmopara halstedii]CEG44943.1 hypothetical protein PHALS_01266 [Plasmopara halstedii]|eukprot:XP_024581312.1 hypothetical protein PHALS_01266 [Plasmopara halstedii]
MKVPSRKRLYPVRALLRHQSLECLFYGGNSRSGPHRARPPGLDSASATLWDLLEQGQIFDHLTFLILDEFSSVLAFKGLIAQRSNFTVETIFSFTRARSRCVMPASW